MKNLNHRNNLNHPNNPTHGGFSIIELVFAMMFLTIIILGVVSLQTSNLGMMNGQKNQIQAHFLAIQGAQIAKAIGLSSLPDCDSVCSRKIKLDADIYSLEEIGASTEEIEVGNQIFNRTIQILKPGPGMPDSAKVASIVEWEDSTGDHSLSDNSHVQADLIVFKLN